MTQGNWDMVIRNGSIVDGTGTGMFKADIAIRDACIAEIGHVSGAGDVEIDASGLIVTPGFVDVHTHYDGQATWDECLAPSSWHGVTTAVVGNCGVGFAPCRPDDHDRLVKLMEGVEDIPGVVLTEGLPWTWETFPQYLDEIETRPHDIDIATQIPHGPLRVYVMGERAERLEPATPEDIAQMASLAGEAVRAGALGFSSSRTINHRTSEGRPTPSLKAAADELLGIADALKRENAGTLQFVSDFADIESETSMLHSLVRESGRPLSVSLSQVDGSPEAWREILAWVGQAQAEGHSILAQVAGRPVGILLGFNVTMNPFDRTPTYRQLAGLAPHERIARLSTAPVREAILVEFASEEVSPRFAPFRNFAKMFLLGDPPDYEQPAEASIASLAAALGLSPAEYAYDRLLEENGEALIYLPFMNYAQGNLDAALEMMLDPNSILGLSDGGAHLGSICDGSFPTHMLTFWTRDRTRGPRLPVETVVKWHTHDTARAVGLADRGLLKPGYKADLNIIDYANLRLHAPRMVRDLPAGGGRLLQRADGYRWTIVSGVIAYKNGNWTGATPGKLIRGAQSAPSASEASAERVESKGEQR